VSLLVTLAACVVAILYGIGRAALRHHRRRAADPRIVIVEIRQTDR
jgi:hypothetical protein